MVLSTDTPTPDALPDPGPTEQKPTGSPFHINIARGLTVAAGMGVALLIAITFHAGWYGTTTSGYVALRNLGVILTVCGYLGALWARGQHHRKVAEEKSRAILLREMIKAVRAICVETAQDCRRQHLQTADTLTTILEEDTACRDAAVIAMTKAVSTMRSVISGFQPKAVAPSRVPVDASPSVRELSERLDELQAQLSKSDDEKFLQATADAFELGQEIARNRPDADRG